MLKAIAALAAALLLFIALAVAAAGGLFSMLAGSPSRPSHAALADIPATYLHYYEEAAATCPGLDWSVLAAIGKAESDHGRSTQPGVRSGANAAGARGPMQFLPATFTAVTARHPALAGRPSSPYAPRDAIQAAASYLCDSGARNGRHLRQAIYTYNRADWYVTQVLSQARRYRNAATSASTPSAAAARAVAYARKQVGLPYLWGGEGPPAGDAGFDCSGLTQAAYAAAGITLPRTAQQQYVAGPRIPSQQALRAGDLVFYGSSERSVDHVGLYVGGARMIDAPSPGKKIRLGPYRYPADHFLAATRPTAHSASSGL
ncbi:NlpC/P60 family protein [Streptomyces sp. ODS28]|uniref:C40 family peptidase n=1 Tax=Streptomyces sp. ODS28 TaxID=3136688 RepID=UPI0031E797D2